MLAIPSQAPLNGNSPVTSQTPLCQGLFIMSLQKSVQGTTKSPEVSDPVSTKSQ